MGFRCISEITEENKRYLGSVICKDRLFFYGRIFYLELEDQKTGILTRKKVAKSGYYGIHPLLPVDGWYPLFSNFQFTSQGLELEVRMTDTILGKNRFKKKFTIPVQVNSVRENSTIFYDN